MKYNRDFALYSFFQGVRQETERFCGFIFSWLQNYPVPDDGGEGREQTEHRSDLLSETRGVRRVITIIQVK